MLISRYSPCQKSNGGCGHETDAFNRYSMPAARMVYFHCTSPSNVTINYTGGSEVAGRLSLKRWSSQVRARQGNKVISGSSGTDSLVFSIQLQRNRRGLQVWQLDVGSMILNARPYSIQTHFTRQSRISTSIHCFAEATDIPRYRRDWYHVICPGSISGKVTVNYPVNLKHISCNISGTSYNATADDTGAFKISNIPKGLTLFLYVYRNRF